MLRHKLILLKISHCYQQYQGHKVKGSGHHITDWTNTHYSKKRGHWCVNILTQSCISWKLCHARIYACPCILQSLHLTKSCMFHTAMIFSSLTLTSTWWNTCLEMWYQFHCLRSCRSGTQLASFSMDSRAICTTFHPIMHAANEELPLRPPIYHMTLLYSIHHYGGFINMQINHYITGIKESEYCSNWDQNPLKAAGSTPTISIAFNFTRNLLMELFALVPWLLRRNPYMALNSCHL